MVRFKVLLGFLRLGIAKKVEFGRNVITKLTGNANFPTPDPSLAQAATLCNNLETAQIAADGGGKASTAAMHAAEKLWDEGFRKLSLYVEKVAGGNEALILSSGFDASGLRNIPAHPEFDVKTGKLEGEVILTHKTLKGTVAYIWECSPDPLPAGNDGWKQVGVSIQAKFKVSGLESQRKYWFRVSIVTRKGQCPWSDPLLLRVP
jgi:hypothetical protein